jgi:uncharacterized protein
MQRKVFKCVPGSKHCGLLGVSRVQMSIFQRAAVVILGSFLTLILPCSGFAELAKPSFNCRKAHSPDELAICHDSHLAELDQAASIDYSLATHYKGDGADVFSDEAHKIAKDALDARHACGSDRLCILDQQVLLIESLSEEGSGPPTSSATIPVPSWVGACRLKLFSERSHPSSKGLPDRVGQCTVTRITSFKASADYAENRGYSEVSYANGGYQVSQPGFVPAIAESRGGDKVLLCLVSIPKNCPPEDDRGRLYSGTNLRTGGSWLLPDSIHMCGGA